MIDWVPMTRSVGRSILDWALPPRCAACGVVVVGDAGFCPECWGTLHFLGPPACAQCDRPFAAPQGEGALCGACMADPPPYARVHALCAYGPVPRTVVLRFKYGRRTAMARLIARLMRTRMAAIGVPVGGGSVGTDEAHQDPPLIIPVPLHRARLWSRGFNQSVEIGRVLARESGLVMIPDALVRTRNTPPLRGRGRSQRAQLVRGAFAVTDRRRIALKGRTVLLIDDVFTTGATAAACAKALLRAGAARVEVVVFARVLDEGYDPGIDTPSAGADMLGTG